MEQEVSAPSPSLPVRFARTTWRPIRALWKLAGALLALLYKDPKPWLLEVGIAGFLAGFFVFPNNFVHGLWFVFTVVIPVWRWRQRDLDSKILDDSAFWLLSFLLVWMLGTSLIIAAPGVDFGDAVVSLADAAGVLCLYAALAVLLRSRFQETRRLLTPFPIAGALMTVVSFFWFYGVAGNEFPAERLRNVVVHFDSGGSIPLSPV